TQVVKWGYFTCCAGDGITRRLQVHIWTRPRCQGAREWTNTLRDRCRHISVYGLLSACKLKMMMSDREPRAYMRSLLGERPPGPDVLRSLSPQRPHGIGVPWIEPGWPRDGLTNLLISQVASLLRNSLEIRHTPPTSGVAYCRLTLCHAR